MGRNVVIGSGSVVAKDIHNNVVAVGNPCRVKGKEQRMTESIIRIEN